LYVCRLNLIKYMNISIINNFKEVGPENNCITKYKKNIKYCIYQRITIDWDDVADDDDQIKKLISWSIWFEKNRTRLKIDGGTPGRGIPCIWNDCQLSITSALTVSTLQYTADNDCDITKKPKNDGCVRSFSVCAAFTPDTCSPDTSCIHFYPCTYRLSPTKLSSRRHV